MRTRPVLDVEAEIGAAAGLGLAAHLLASRAQRERELPQRAQRLAEGQRRGRIVQHRLGDLVVEGVVPKVGGDADPVHRGEAALYRGAGGVEVRIQRECRPLRALVQRIGTDRLLGKHGDLAAGHVDGGHPLARHRVERALPGDGQGGRSDVDADPQPAARQGLHGKRVVDLGGGGVVDREGFHRRELERQVRRRRGRQLREAGAVREMLDGEAREMEIVRGGEGAELQQQALGRLAGALAGALQRAVLDALLVRPHQQHRRALGDRRRQAALGHRLRVLLEHLVLLAPPLHGGERQAQRLFGRGAIAALALALEVDGSALQPEQHARGLHRVRPPAEVLAGEVGEAELVARRALPEEVDVELVGHPLGGRQQLRRRRGLEAEHHVPALHLAALAAGVLDLQAGGSLGQDGAGLEAAVFLE